MSPNPISSNQLLVGGVAVLAAIGVAFALAKSSSASAPAPGGDGSLAPFVGTWKVVPPFDSEFGNVTEGRLTINADGTFVVTGNPKINNAPGTCTASGSIAVANGVMTATPKSVSCKPDVQFDPGLINKPDSLPIKSSQKDSFVIGNDNFNLTFTRVP